MRPPCGRGRPSGRTYLRLPVNPDDGFPQAFRAALGISVESFETDFRRYLGWRGFMPAPPPLD